MKKHLKLTLALAITICLCTTSIFAVDGSWIVDSDSSWSTAANWNNNIIADGATYTATFTNQITGAPRSLNVDSPRTIGNMSFGAGPAFIGYYWYFYGSEITLDNGGSTPQLDVNDTVYGAMLANPIAGSDGFDKTGNPYAGIADYNQIRLYADNSISGDVTVVNGLLGIYHNNALDKADITVNSGAILEIPLDITMNGKPITVNGTYGIVARAGSGGLNNNVVLKAAKAVLVQGPVTNNLNGTINVDAGASAYAGIELTGDASILNINSNIIGTGDLAFIGSSSTGIHVMTFNINKPGTYSGNNTYLQGYSASPRYEVNCFNAFSNSVLNVVNSGVNLPEATTLDLNNNTQQVYYLYMNSAGTTPAGQQIVLTAGTAGRMEVSSWSQVDGKAIISGGNHQFTPYMAIQANSKLILTNTYINCPNEFLVWGANSSLTLENSVIAKNNLTRFPGHAAGSTLNLNSGSKIELSGTWNDPNTQQSTQSVINFNGGIVSDGTYGPHASFGDYNWLRAGSSNLVQAGGAIIEVNNVNGREITEPLLHDPALGGTADGGLTKIGPQTLILAGANNYTGPTTVTNGTLVVANTTAGSGITVKQWAKYGVPFTHIVNTPITVENDGKVDFATTGVALSGSKITVQDGGSVYCDAAITFTNNNNIDFQGWGHGGGGIEIYNTVAYGVYNGTNTVTAAGTRVFCHGAGGSMTFNGPFAGSEEVHLIGQGGDAAHIHNFYLNAKNINTSRTTLRTYAADTTYELGVTDCFPTDQQLELLVHNWGTTYCNVHLDLNSYNQSVASLELNCGAGEDYVEVTGNAGSKLTVAGNVNQSGGTAEVTTATLEVGGILTVDGTMLGINNVSLLSGASIKGSGILGGALTIPSGAAIAPGNSIGTLNTGSIVMNAGSIYDWELGDTSIGDADLVNINGTLTIGSVANAITVNVIKVSGVTQPGDTMTLYATSGGVSGNASSIFMDYTGSSSIDGPDNPTISGNDIVISGLTPEPGFIGMIVLGALAFLRRKK